MPPVDFDPKNEVRRITAALQTAVRLSGVTYRQIERELGMGSGYLTRLLTGQAKLRITHLLAICEVIGLPFGTFLAALYSARPPASERELRLSRGLAELQERDPESLLAELRVFLAELEGHFRGRK